MLNARHVRTSQSVSSPGRLTDSPWHVPPLQLLINPTRTINSKSSRDKIDSASGKIGTPLHQKAVKLGPLTGHPVRVGALLYGAVSCRKPYDTWVDRGGPPSEGCSTRLNSSEYAEHAASSSMEVMVAAPPTLRALTDCYNTAPATSYRAGNSEEEYSLYPEFSNGLSNTACSIPPQHRNVQRIQQPYEALFAFTMRMTWRTG
ncbi:hypothetical protein K466DRAFT_356892 [Polyporus arcularius HHB13444]|uniref:Uncharacterized protein n=1 Tax=Polyporus arcularius HHB13444 TaxID=1314778 RepID=A0A5C3PMF1_9APHY|nr:hypothetical protein K466DRAFT_356892 [Polyporus arcularius HHB13444]